MTKRIGLVGAVLVALTCAAPGFAGASTGLTSPSGTLVPIVTRITATSFGRIAITSSKLGELKCEKMVIDSWLQKNNASEGVEIAGASGENKATACSTPGKQAFMLTEIVLSNLKSPASTPGKGTASFSFTATYPGPQSCKYRAENDGFTYIANSDVIQFAQGPLTVVSGTNCGASTFDGTFELEITTTRSFVFVM